MHCNFVFFRPVEDYSFLASEIDLFLISGKRCEGQSIVVLFKDGRLNIRQIKSQTL